MPSRRPKQLAPVPDIYVHALKEALRLKKIEPHPYLVVGEKVRITNGAMAGAEGILVRKKNDLRVVITLEMMFQSISLEVDASTWKLSLRHGCRSPHASGHTSCQRGKNPEVNGLRNSASEKRSSQCLRPSH